MLELELGVTVRVRVKGPPRFRPLGGGLEFRPTVRVRVVALLLELELRIHPV